MTRTAKSFQLLALTATSILHAAASATPDTTTPTSVQAPVTAETCESRGINYITALPDFESVCYRQRPSEVDGLPPATATSSSDEQTTGISESAVAIEPSTPTIIEEGEPATQTSIAESTLTPESTIESVASHETDDVFSDASFLSFEDWKKQVMENQQGTGGAKDSEKQRKPESGQDTLESYEDDHEIDIDFGAYLGERREQKVQDPSNDEDKASTQAQESEDVAKAEKPKRHPKDAGKTWKERTNFASIDSGAQVMKANPEAKSTSALLSEYRDAYMLNTCSAKNKFALIELSDSILVETIALANFEFFSSTFREFRVSVTDRYPLKLDRWMELGTFEAQNSREVQAFLVEDPRIWARYLKIEFLSHYGKEFYCPVSLLRVHGRTMIEDILSPDQPAGADEEEAGAAPQEEDIVAEAVADAVKEESVADGPKELKEAQTTASESGETGESKTGEQATAPREAQATASESGEVVESITTEQASETTHPSINSEVPQLVQNASVESQASLWSERKIDNLFGEGYRHANMCHPSDSPAPVQQITSTAANTTAPSHSSTSQSVIADTQTTPNVTAASTQSSSSPTLNETHDVPVSTITPDPEVRAKLQTALKVPDQAASINSSSIVAVQNITAAATNKTSSTSSSAYSPQPTTQDSFFKNVSKRLQLLEQNSTLSLKYIEDQSRHLREAFNKVEKRQLSKTTLFLESLNATVFSELRQFSEQYDQIWQSTVIELESQKDLLRREATAMGSRLTLLADELVFQKRMGIVQSILLLLCLVLVLFSRYLPGGMDLPRPQNIDSKRSLHGRYDAATNNWTEMGHWKQRSADSVPSRNQLDSPLTPLSGYSENEDEREYRDYGDDSSHRGASPDGRRTGGGLGFSYINPPVEEGAQASRRRSFMRSNSTSGLPGDGARKYSSDAEQDSSGRLSPAETTAYAHPGICITPDSPQSPQSPIVSQRKPLPALPMES